MSVQLTYSAETVLRFNDGTEAAASDQMSGLINMSLGTRVSDTTIVNTSVGFGLTRAHRISRSAFPCPSIFQAFLNRDDGMGTGDKE